MLVNGVRCIARKCLLKNAPSAKNLTCVLLWKTVNFSSSNPVSALFPFFWFYAAESSVFPSADVGHGQQGALLENSLFLDKATDVL